MPGEQLSIRKTAEALGVSMMPVRDAISRLVADHALEVTPNRSVRVPVLSLATFTEITRIRMEIEGMAAAEAAQRPVDVLLPAIEALNAELSREMTKAQADTAVLVSLNQQFHFSVYEAAQMPVLFKMIESLWLRIGPILNYDLRQGSPRTTEQVAVAHHRHLIDALRRGESQAARQAVADDIREAYEYIATRTPSLFLAPASAGTHEPTGDAAAALPDPVAR